MRSQLRYVVQDQAGNIRAGQTVELFNFGTTTPISNTLYATPTSIVAVNPSTMMTDATGEIELWIVGNSPPVTIRVGGASGVTETVYFVPDPSLLPDVTAIEADIDRLEDLVEGASRGPWRFDVEAYANAADLAADGTFKIDVSATYAINAAAAAMRAGTITNAAGASFGWPRARRLVFNSPVYTISTTANLTNLYGCILQSGAGYSTFYCGDSWVAVAPPALPVTAAVDSPMFDLTATLGCRFENLQLNAQPLLAPTAPLVAPAVGWLVASSESWDGAVWSGGGADSTGNTFVGCSASGWFRNACWAFVNSLIHEMHGCGGTIYTNNASAHALYCGRTTLSGAGQPLFGGPVDSPYYPHDAGAAVGQKRMCRQEIGAGAIRCVATEFHDLARVSAGGSGQSALSSTVLLYKVIGFEIAGKQVPASSSGLSFMEVQGYSYLVSFKGVEFYNDAVGNASSDPSYILFNNGCVIATPMQQTSLEDCTLNLTLVQAVIGGVSGAAFTGLTVEKCQPGASGKIFDTSSTFVGAATDETLVRARIECAGRAVAVGGSIGATVDLYEPGAITYSGGGVNKSRRYAANGAITQGTGGLTIVDGGLVVSAGGLNVTGTGLVSTDFSLRHLIGIGSPLVAGDFALAAGWGSTASVGSIRGTDLACTFTITSAGVGQGANPTVTLTFKASYGGVAPNVIASWNGGSGATGIPGTAFLGAGAANVVITFIGTPNAGQTYTCTVIGIA